MRAPDPTEPEPLSLPVVVVGLVVAALVWLSVTRFLVNRRGRPPRPVPRADALPFGPLAFAIFFLVQTAVGLAFGERIRDAGVLAQVALVLPIDLVAVLVPLALARRARVHADEFGLAVGRGAVRPGDFGIAIGIYLSAVPTFLFAGMLNEWISARAGVDATQDIVRSLLASSAARESVLVFATVAIAVPILEEILFRGLLQRALRTRMTAAGAICVTAVLFAAAHSNAAVPVFVIGLALGIACEVTGSVWPGVLVHAIHNGSQLAYICYLGK